MAIESKEICLLFINSWQPYSLWPCMSKSEWAYWVQAFGSIAAIFGSAYLAKYQFLKSLKLKKTYAGDLLIEFFTCFHYYSDNLHLFDQNLVKGRVSHQQIKRFKIYIDELSAVLRGVKLEDLSSEWSVACVHARINIAVLQEMYASLDNLLEKNLSNSPFFSMEAIIDSNDEDFNKKKKIYSEVVMMSFHAIKISDSIIEIGKKAIKYKYVQMRVARSEGLYKHFDDLHK